MHCAHATLHSAGFVPKDPERVTWRNTENPLQNPPWQEQNEISKNRGVRERMQSGRGRRGGVKKEEEYQERKRKKKKSRRKKKKRRGGGAGRREQERDGRTENYSESI